jgi:opacity protein-like surface antigen
MKSTLGASALAFAILALASTAALAENGSGFYLGGGIGYAGQRVDCDAASDCSNSHTGVKLLGGYQVMPNFAIESSYGHTGRTRGSALGLDASIKTRSFTIAALGIYPLSKEAELFGKLGAHSTRTKLDFTTLSVNGSESYKGSGLLFGLGAQYRFSSSLIGRVEYERLSRAVRIEDERADINLVTASMIYQF